MSPQEFNDLRLDVKQTLARFDLDLRGQKIKLAKKLSEKTGRSISSQSLIMALSGLRTTDAYRQILEDMKSMLAEMQQA